MVNLSSTETFKLGVMHFRLDEAIRAEMRRRLPDWVRLRRLRKLKLAVKDRLHRIG